MTNDFFIENSALAGRDQEIFAKWLKEYAADLEISSFFEERSDSTVAEGWTEDIEKLRNLAAEETQSVKPGDIRLLNENCVSDKSILVPVLVLTQWTDNMWLVAPFSRFHTPATNGEIASELDFHKYSVLEVWNSFTIPDICLFRNSVFLRSISDQKRKEFCSVFFHLLSNDQLDPKTETRLGPPILTEIDPRFQYIQNEKEQIRPIREIAQETVSILKSLSETFSAPVAALAAGAERENLYAECKIIGFSSIFTFQYEFSKKILRLKVFDASQNPINDFDRWSLIDHTGKVLGTLKDSKCIVMNFELIDGRLGLTDLDGKIHAFIIKRR